MEAARLRMADLCARGEHCSHEIAEKLRKMQISHSVAEEIIDYLIENRYIDNLRFACAFARDKVKFSGWGKNKIRMALAAKRIDSSDIREALDEIDEDDYLNAVRKVAGAKARSLDLDDYDERSKLFRHLASRGFEAGIISATIRFLRED